jgi:hypothetical protein
MLIWCTLELPDTGMASEVLQGCYGRFSGQYINLSQVSVLETDSTELIGQFLAKNSPGMLIARVYE